MGEHPSSTRHSVSRWLLLLPVLAGVISSAPLIAAIPRMRLLGDDYIVAAYVSVLGIGDSSGLWLNFYSSPVATLGLFTHGWFLVNTSPAFAYFPSSLLLLVLVSIVGFVALRLASRTRPPLTWIVASIPVTVALWILAFGGLGGVHDTVTLVAQLNWPSAAYRQLLALSYFAAIAAIVLLRPRLMWWSLLPVYLLGTLVTLVSLNPLPDLLAYFLTTVIVIIANSRAHGDLHRRQRMVVTSMLALGQASGIAYLLLSPGMQGRRKWLDFPGYDPPIISSVVQQIPIFLREALNPTLPIVVLVAAALTMVVTRALPRHTAPEGAVGFQLKLLLVGVSSLFALLAVTGSTNVLLGPAAVWHRWGLQEVSFIGAVLIGIAIAPRLTTRIGLRGLSALATFGLVLALIPSISAHNLIEDRQVRWPEGDAPMSYIWDKEMWSTCWGVLTQRAQRQHAGTFIPINPCGDLIEVSSPE